MCRSVYLLVLMFTIFSSSLISSSAVTQTVIPGENITLHCNISQSTEMVWFCSTTQELTIIISATKGNLKKELQVNYNKDPHRFKVLLQNTNSGQVSLGLIIMDIRQSDIGLYYCGARQEGFFDFARGIHLQFTGIHQFFCLGEPVNVPWRRGFPFRNRCSEVHVRDCAVLDASHCCLLFYRSRDHTLSQCRIQTRPSFILLQEVCE
ncbi:uncharacterized protein LOC113651636 isoform X2 [Tachysurus fulvidraco]|uniref:uncharacterized protein LOC113651636 isoform X2 n=1 Tax=Tachysurus fulvidraco TaxID=1234273 RepID=UPI001FEFD960|nr:uncharacterized protein LOC113651636 isoform X2 [Tachysurus fulvidraco]